MFKSFAVLLTVLNVLALSACGVFSSENRSTLFDSGIAVTQVIRDKSTYPAEVKERAALAGAFLAGFKEALEEEQEDRVKAIAPCAVEVLEALAKDIADVPALQHTVLGASGLLRGYGGVCEH